MNNEKISTKKLTLNIESHTNEQKEMKLTIQNQKILIQKIPKLENEIDKLKLKLLEKDEIIKNALTNLDS